MPIVDGYNQSEEAWEAGEEDDFEVLPASSLTLAQSCIFNPLSQLLVALPAYRTPSRVPSTYVVDMTLSAKERKKAKDHHRACHWRAEECGAVQAASGVYMKGVAIKKCDATKALALVAKYLESVRPGGWTGSQSCASYPTILSVTDVLKISSLRLVPWDAKCSRLIHAADGVNWAALLGHPGDGDIWMSLMHKVDSLLSNVHSCLRLPRHSNRRGTYDTIASGYSHGQGQIHPTNFSISAHNQPIVEEILQSREVQQVTRFVDRTSSPFFHPA
ncbi:hypothetical protein BDP27DRAFT_1429696 [Rhodocollybia butyracea]|uniref:Uncharacterized protein n=1 Tax=Rhodocollybia butyracea TaxID=206335 RepID=A0A9P5U0P4_9AGAR|nr:hypothetical protein BDP27DRAFT_1429696 [Rhodocollybia butyracea]